MVKIRTHHDVDGLISGYFTSLGIKSSDIEIWDGQFGDTTGLTKDDYMTDMRPSDPNWEGTCIDHHLPHPDNRKYKLISDEVPASLIAFRKYQKEIPKSEWWKLAIGLMGDGQPELIPTEVFLECPMLMSRVKTSAKESYGNWKVSYFPVYKLLSSPINAFLRQRNFKMALNMVTFKNTPLEIINDTEAKIAKTNVRNEYKRIIMSAESHEFNSLNVFFFTSAYRMSGYIASSLQSSMGSKTVMCINTKTGRGSLRGDLAYYWRDKLKGKSYIVIDGHPKFCGVTFTGKPEQLIKDIVELS